MSLTDNLGCEDEGNNEHEITRLTPRQYFGLMYEIAIASFTHPFSTTVLELDTSSGKTNTYNQ